MKELPLFKGDVQIGVITIMDDGTFKVVPTSPKYSLFIEDYKERVKEMRRKLELPPERLTQDEMKKDAYRLSVYELIGSDLKNLYSAGYLFEE